MSDINVEPQEALKLAKESVALAESLNKDTKERMAQTRAMHDAMLVSQRRVCYAFSTLLPKPRQSDFLTAISPEALKDEAKSILDQVSKRQESDVINTLVNLALANFDVIEITIDICGHHNQLNVQVVKLGDMVKHQYQNVPRLLNETVYLDGFSYQEGVTVLDKLLQLEDKLIDLIAEAREASETIAEVGA